MNYGSYTANVHSQQDVISSETLPHIVTGRLYRVIPAAGTITLTIPNAVNVPDGWWFIVEQIGEGTVIVQSMDATFIKILNTHEQSITVQDIGISYDIITSYGYGLNGGGIELALVSLTPKETLEVPKGYLLVAAISNGTATNFKIGTSDGLDDIIADTNIVPNYVIDKFDYSGSSRDLFLEASSNVDIVLVFFKINATTALPDIETANLVERNNGLTIFSFEIANNITIPNGSEINLFNPTNGMLSTNGTLTISGDSWDRMTTFDNEYIRPDEYLHTQNPHHGIETEFFARIPTIIGGAVARGLIMELRRRTAASPIIPVAIPGREVEVLTNQAVTTATLQRLPTRSIGNDDNYYVYGYTLFVNNQSGATITLPAGETIRIEVYNNYRKPISFNNLNSPNL